MTTKNPLKMLLLLSVIAVVESQILIARCKICQRCTYCTNDVLYDCTIDDVYASILGKNPSLSSAFPVNILKTVNGTISTYFFQLSNNQNISYQIKPKNTVQVLANATNSSKTASVVSSSSSVNQQGSNSIVSSSATVKPLGWIGLSNASQVILSYVISHFHLSTSSVVQSLTQEPNLNTYTAIVKSLDSNIKMTVNINPIDFTLKVISIAFLSGSLENASATSASVNNNKTTNNPPANQQAGVQATSSLSSSIKIAKGLSVNGSLQSLLNYLSINYSQLNNFQLDAYSTTDNTNYNLNLSNVAFPSIKYAFKVLILVPIAGNLRGMGIPSQTFQIMEYSLVNTTSLGRFTPLKASQQLHSDPYAEKVINQIRDQMFQPLDLQNLGLVNISSSLPFYILYYEMPTQVFQFLVSFDVLTAKIRIIEENITDKKSVTTKQPTQSSSSQQATSVTTQNPPSPSSPSSIAATQTATTANNNLNLVQVKQVFNASNSVISLNSSKIAANILSNTPNLTTSPPNPSPIPNQIPLVQVQPPSTIIAPNYINFRLDPLFLQAASAINAVYSFSPSSIIKVSLVNLPNIRRYNITLNLNLQSGKYLQFLADYNTATKSVAFSNFAYTPQTPLDSSLFQPYALATIGSNQVVMNIISFIFIQYPKYFSTSVSSILDVSAYPPYFNITYNNSAFGLLNFLCEYNYFTANTLIVNYSTSQLPTKSNSVQANASILQSTATSKPTSLSNVAVQTEVTNTQNSSSDAANASGTGSSDLFCITYQKGQCSQCAFRFYYDKSKQKCVSVQDWCYEFDYTNCICLTCFNGYSLVGGLCQSPSP